MLKHFIPGALAFSTACMSNAQSNITIFGTVDNGYAHVSANGGSSSSGMIFGGANVGRLGFRGTEDLGGGLAASFWLEGQVATDTGAGAAAGGGLDFARRSTVSLSGPFGEVRLGRDYTSIYLSMLAYDPWGQRGIGNIEFSGFSAGGLGTYTRNSNGIAYFLPSNLGGFYGTIKYAFGERPSNTNAVPISTTSADAVATSRTGNSYGARVGYANGPLDVSVATTMFKDAVRTVAGAPVTYYANDYKVSNIGASYDFGLLKLMALYQRERINGVATIAGFGYDTLSLGSTVPVGSFGLVKIAVARYKIKDANKSFNKHSIGYLHNLSKRTALYADASRINNQGESRATFGGIGGITMPTPSAGGAVTGYVVGIRHFF